MLPTGLQHEADTPATLTGTIGVHLGLAAPPAQAVPPSLLTP